MSSNKTQTLFKGLSVQTLVTIIMGVLELVFFAIMSRLLTKADFGYYAALTGVMAIFMSISEAGLGSSVIQKKNASNEHISTAFTLSCILGFSFSIILCIIAPWIADLIADETLTLPLRIMSFAILFHSLTSIGNSILYRKLNFKRIGLNSVISYLLSASIGIIMAYNGFGLMSIVAHAVSHALFLVILLYVFSVEIPKFKISKKESKEIVSFGGWLTLGVILNNISHQLDKLVLSKWISVSALGSYNRPAGFVSNISSRINGIFDTVLFPMLSDLQDNRDKVQNILTRAVSLLNSFSVILAAVFFFNAELIITIFFGSEWLELVTIMQIISLSVIFNIDGRLVDCFFRSLGLVKLGFYLRCLAVLMTLTCLYIGAQHDIIGVAWGLFISNVTMIFIKMISLCIAMKCHIVPLFISWIKAWKPAVIPCLVGIIYLSLPHNVIINISFAILFALLVLCEFIFFPLLVGKEYKTTVYPMIEKVKAKIIK